MVKAILLDFWGTIVENGVFPSPVKQVRFILDLDIEFSEYIQKFEETMMLKEFESLTAAFTEVCKAFKVEPTEDKIEKLVGMWNKNKFFAKPYPDTKNTLDKLKETYRLILISNTDCFSVKEILEKFQLENYFDEVLLSYETGKLKTHEGFFDDLLKKLKLKKEEVIMVGDSLQSDMAPAEAAGIRSVLIDRRGRREYKEKVKYLSEIPKLLE
ncbi:MAG: HAD family hydrolase [Nanoarchaeota archaeon]